MLKSLFMSLWAHVWRHCKFMCVVAPYRTILQYCRCDTPFQAILSPQNGAMLSLAPSFIQAHLSNTPCCIARYEVYRYWASKFMCFALCRSPEIIVSSLPKNLHNEIWEEDSINARPLNDCALGRILDVLRGPYLV